MLRSFGTGINNTYNASKEWDFTELSHPSLIFLWDFEESDLLILPADSRDIHMLTTEHNAFNNGLAAIDGWT
ncbi:hypothetical protein D3C72_982700 [compost metagenome]